MFKKKKAIRLSVCLLFGMYLLLSVSAMLSQAADITNKVDITGIEITKNAGNEVTESDPINVSDSVAITYYWEIPESKMTGINSGDTFTITLPDDVYFDFPDSGPYILTNPSGGPSLGSFVIENNVIVVSLNDEGASQIRLFNGKITVHGWAREAGENIDGGGNGSEEVPGLIVVDPGGGEGQVVDEEEYKEENLPFDKQGKQTTGTNEIRWSFRVNYQGLSDMIESYHDGTPMSTRTRGLLIDELEAGTKFQPGSLFVTVPIFTTTPSGKMGTRVVADTSNIQIQHEFVEVPQLPGETIGTFQERVRQTPFNGIDSLAYGVYTDSMNIDTVFIAFGDLPSSSYSYNDIHGSNIIETAILSDISLTSQQKDTLVDIYCNTATSPGDTGIVAYDVSFAADVLVEDGYNETATSNAAEFIWGDNDSESSAITVPFNKVGGNVEGGIVKAFKEVVGTGLLEEPQYFEFELIDETAGDIPVAYGITTNMVYSKGVQEQVDFYKDRSAEGVYTNQIIGSTTTTGWGSVLTDGHTYYIREVNSAGYDVAISCDNISERNYFNYDASQSKIWTFIIVNSEPLLIRAEKVLSGEGTLDTPLTFEFEIQDSLGIPVAYGKTTVHANEIGYQISFYSTADYASENLISNWKSLLIHGEQYTIVETDTTGYDVTYYIDGMTQEGNSFIADTEAGGNIHFVVKNAEADTGTSSTDSSSSSESTTTDTSSESTSTTTSAESSSTSDTTTSTESGSTSETSTTSTSESESSSSTTSESSSGTSTSSDSSSGSSTSETSSDSSDESSGNSSGSHSSEDTSDESSDSSNSDSSGGMSGSFDSESSSDTSSSFDSESSSGSSGSFESESSDGTSDGSDTTITSETTGSSDSESGSHSTEKTTSDSSIISSSTTDSSEVSTTSESENQSGNSASTSEASTDSSGDNKPVTNSSSNTTAALGENSGTGSKKNYPSTAEEKDTLTVAIGVLLLLAYRFLRTRKYSPDSQD